MRARVRWQRGDEKMILHMGIPACIQRFPYAYGDLVNHNPCMHTGIHRYLYACRDCSWSLYAYMGIITLQSLYAYGAFQRSPYAYRDLVNYNSCMHVGIHRYPYAYRDCSWSPYAYGDHYISIPVCIWGFVWCPYAYGDFSVTPRVLTETISTWEIKSYIPICKISHTEIAVCIWGSPYAYGWGLLKSLHMGSAPCMHNEIGK